MKKLFILLSIIIPSYSFPQENDDDKKIHFGIKAGTAITGLTPKKFNNKEYRDTWGFLYGIRAQIPAGKKFLLITEANMAPKGAKIFYSGSSSDLYPELSVILEIVPNLLYKIPAKSGIFMIGGGPFAGFNLSQYSSILGKNDFGINLLAAYRIPIGLSVELNFNKGFVKQNPGDNYTEVPDNMTTNYFGICIGYMF